MVTGVPSFYRTESRELIIEKLPDGSTAVYDATSQTLHSLNAPTAAAFEACRERRTLPELVNAMNEALRRPVSEGLALMAVAELERARLVTSEGAAPDNRFASRRNLLRAAGMALPAVLSLTAAQQRAFAATAGSGDPATTAAPTTSTTAAPTATTTTTTTTTTTAAPVPSLTGASGNVVLSSYCPVIITITGQNTHFVQGTTTVAFSDATVPGAVIATNNVTVGSATQLTAVAEWNGGGGAVGDSINVTVTTGGEVVTGIGMISMVAFVNNGSCTAVP